MTIELYQKPNGRWELKMRERPRGQRCLVDRCGRRPSSRKDRICSRCKMRRWRLNNPMQASFNWLRSSAKKRHIVFELTFAEFSAWALETGYLDKRGKTINDFHCDRIDPEQGYKIGNLQLLPASENVRKDPWRKGWRSRAGVESTSENPY